MQNEVQSHCFCANQITIHPFAIHNKKDGILLNKSLAVLSDCLKHDSSTVHTFFQPVIYFIKELLLNVSKLIVFTDGCGTQYKNKQKFVNLCYFELDFGVSVEWNVHATAHGKSACDGIGGTQKRLARKACLQDRITI